MSEESLAGADEQPPASAPSSHPVPGAAAPPVVSIVDTIFDLNGFLSGDVRRAEKTARFCTAPWIEADIDELQAELEMLTDDNGNPLPTPDRSLGDAGRTAEQVALELQVKQAEYGAAFRSVRMAQLSSDDWKEFKAKWREVLDAPPPYSNDFYNDLIEVSAANPKITAAQAAELRTMLGDPQMDELSSKAWAVNAHSGVSIPKSLLSSHVLKRAMRGQS